MNKALLLTFMAALGLSACGGARTEREVQAPISVPAPARTQVRVRVKGDASAIEGCVFKVDHPHRSLHDPTTVNVVAWVECNAVMDHIDMEVGLMFNGVEVGRKAFSAVGTKKLEGNASAPCVNGTYNGSAGVGVTFPPPAIPPIGYGTAGSGNVSVTNCPN